MKRNYVQNKAASTGLPQASRMQIPEELPENCSRICMPEGDGEFLTYNIRDDTMSPTLKYGDIVICSLFNAKEDITDNEIYVIVTKSVFVRRIKRIFGANGDWDQLSLMSDKKGSKLQGFIHRNKVFRLYRVLRKLSII